MTHPRLLKIKIKSLAAEALIIKHGQCKVKKSRKRLSMLQRTEAATRFTAIGHEMHHHRVIDLRREQRSALLAYAFIRKRKATECEKSPLRVPMRIRTRAATIAVRFGAGRPEAVRKEMDSWLKGETTNVALAA